MTPAPAAAPRALSAHKEYSFMVRTKIPGGKLTSAQLLAELDLCDELGNSTLRITTRQGLQLHGVLKSHLKQAIAASTTCNFRPWPPAEMSSVTSCAARRASTRSRS